MERFLPSLLGGVLSTLSSPIVQEFGLLWGMEKEQRKLESNLRAIGAVLHDAEIRQVKEMAVKDWLQKLKDAADDAEDLADEFMVEALRREAESRDGMRKKVRKFFSPLNPLAFHFKMAHKMQELRERFDVIAKEKDSFHFQVVKSQPPISRTRETHSYVNKSDVYGRDAEKAKIMDLLMNSGGEDEHVSVIPIVGMGGLGKTTLAQLVYNDVASPFEPKMWVYVSDEDFEAVKLLKKLLGAANEGELSGQLSMDKLQNRLREKLKGKRYLLVLDDVWENGRPREDWNELKTILECGAPGSKIIITTRSTTVAAIMGTLPAHQLGKLSENDSWSLFEKLAHPDQRLVSIGRDIVRKCDGVPLAIKTLAGLLASKPSLDEWLHVRDSEFWESQENDEGILPALRLSYNHLTPELKRCFSYCAKIPKGHPFDKDKLIKQWVAHGFIQSSEEGISSEEIGDGFVNELLSRSLFQACEEDVSAEERIAIHYNDSWSRLLFQVSKKDNEHNVTKCRMHDLIHDLLRSVVGKECLVVEASKKTLPKDDTRHLSLDGFKWATKSENLKALEECKKLRSLLLCRYVVDIHICSRFRWLRVLDISWASISFLPNSVGNLKHLRYLDVSGTKITKLPRSICKLHTLQTLIMYETCITKLPNIIKRMTSLRHIESDCANLLEGIEIGELTCLQTLPIITVNRKSRGGIEELQNLNQLRGQLQIRGLENIKNNACARKADLKEKRHLSSLTLSWSDVETIVNTEANPENVIESLEPHSHLKKLSVECYMGTSFPSWIEKLTNLREISLSKCSGCEHLPPLGRVPFLASLDIRDMEAVKCIVEFDRADNNENIFPSLKNLELARMPNLERWWSQQVENEELRRERLQYLRILRISDCPKLIQIPRFLFGTTLEILDIKHVGCGRIEMPTSLPELKRVYLSKMPNLEEFLLIEMGQNSVGLRDLRIMDCPKLISLPYQLKNLSALASLSISDCPNLMLLQDDLQCLSSLESLYIDNSCAGQTSISGGDLIVLPSLRRLTLSNCKNLESFYCDGLRNLTYLGSINCPNLWYTSSDWVRSLTSLQFIVVNGAKSLSQSLGDLKSVRKLCIYDCSDSRNFPESIGNLSSLNYLSISNCPILVSLAKSVGKLSSLFSLSISNCPILASLPESAGNLSSLTELHIKNCPILVALPESIGNLSSLTKLYIKNCPILAALPESVGNLSSLTKLYTKNCPILAALPESVENLSSLTELHIKNCSILAALPKSIGNLSSLTELHIKNCPILAALPESVGNLSSLTKLYIKYCPILAALPESVGNLSSLIELHVKNCPILAGFPESIGNLPSLTSLNIESCLILTALPESVGNLSSLKFLDIENCPILAIIPESIGNLNKLKWLTIHRLSALNFLPDSMTNLTSLTRLKIQSCPIMGCLPESIGNLISLVNLFIEDCVNLRSLPESLENLVSLRFLRISNCPKIVTLLVKLDDYPALEKCLCTKKKKMRKETMGKDWHKVAHIPRIQINGQDPRECFDEDSNDESSEDEEEQGHERTKAFLRSIC